MADFTVTITITGNVNGRAVSIQDSYTVADITEVVEDGQDLGGSYGVTGYKTLQNDDEARGYNAQNGPAFWAIGCDALFSGTFIQTFSDASQMTMNIHGGIPQCFLHGIKSGGNGASATSTSVLPIYDMDNLQISSRSPGWVTVIGLFRTIS